ncbi:hypothetical protein, conserved [Trypanosoma brucei gambiense DAL972]|uniref:Uncharacterized protein n=1 Tax=Trypanosoma brucei gambiense (strain MHOM/CI/86/DAL972) TaxID=679716 RepID=C9ZUN7_TRYB9|nr:hypothetical protein, conserved [Trypanosoma brucei gambiense DAL972]CBH13125.1 hypothetical protein, conserved [Trypanosoma brucei gambiense DAL972]|eukprot:XP_011775402.1 hypothetical protein, conserved [Trypanosoma brucei gambiense DAL972]
MSAPLAPRRTRTVDLELMTREELIELAKKQSITNREKTQYIAHLEELVKDITNQSSNEKVCPAAAVDSGEVTTAEVSQLQHSLLQLQQEIEQERVAFAQDMSRSEELITALREQLEEKTREFQTLRETGSTVLTQSDGIVAAQAKVLEASVQERVRELREYDRLERENHKNRINQLENELQRLRESQQITAQQYTASSGGPSAEAIRESIDREVKEKVEQWQDRVRTVVEQDRKTIQDLRNELSRYQDSDLETQSREEAMHALQQEVEQLKAQLAEAQRSHDEVAVASEVKCREVMESREEAMHALQQEVEQLKAQLAEAQRSHDEVAVASEVKCREVMESREEAMHALQQEVEQLKAQLAEAQRSHDEVAVASEVKCREVMESREEAMHALQQEVEQLKAQLAEAQRSHDEVAVASEVKCREVMESREEAMHALQQEVEQLKAQLAEAQRSHDEVAEGVACDNSASLPLTSKVVEWMDAVGAALSQSDKEETVLVSSLDGWHAEGNRRDEIFCKVIQVFRASMANLQSELLNVAGECVKLKRRVVELQALGKCGVA